MFSLFDCGVHWNCVFWLCLFALVPLCFAFHGLFVISECRWMVFLSLGLKQTMAFFRCHCCAIKILTTECFDLPLGVSLFVAGTLVKLRFASHRLLGALRWTFHVLQLSNMNVVVTLLHCVLHPIGCSVHSTGRCMCYNYQT